MSFLNTWFASKEIDEKPSRPILGKILETLREGVLVVGQDTRILASNAAAYNAFARRNGALEEKRLSEVIRDLSLHEAFRQALQNDKSSDIELEIPGIENANTMSISRRFNSIIPTAQSAFFTTSHR